jgi:transcriptional regulator with XRE-family HTH domain
MNIGSNIKKIRKSKGILQKTLAEMLDNMPISTLANYENNHRIPNIDTIDKIAKALGSSIADLVAFNEISFSCNLISIIQTAYINKNDGYSVRDIFQVLSDDLDLDYELFDCYKAKKTTRMDNSDGTYTFMDVNNEDFDISNNLPIDIQVKLLVYLSNVDYPTFSGFIKIQEKVIHDIPELYETSMKISYMHFVNTLHDNNPNDNRLSDIVEKLNSTGILSVEDIEAIDRYKEAEYVDYALGVSSITNHKNNSYALFIKLLSSLEYKSDEISNNAAYLFKKIKAQIELEMILLKDDDATV